VIGTWLAPSTGLVPVTGFRFLGKGHFQIARLFLVFDLVGASAAHKILDVLDLMDESCNLVR
jgi:hypothetical protein